MRELKFTCPKCGGHAIEAVMTGSTVIKKILGEDGYGSFEYDEMNAQVEQSDVDVRYQCGNCGHTIIEGSEEELLEHLGMPLCLTQGDEVMANGVMLIWDAKTETFKFNGFASDPQVYVDDEEIILHENGEYEFLKEAYCSGDAVEEGDDE